jgi:ubiquinone biosynthesis protein
MSQDFAGVLFRHRERIAEIVDVLARYGFAGLASRVGDLPEAGLAARALARKADAELAAGTAGQRLRGALAELGTSWIKLGQMLSLRPDLVGPDVAAELAQLQANVPPDPAGSVEATILAGLGRPVEEAYGSFESVPLASASVAQAHRATLVDGTAVVVKVVHAGARQRVLEDLELMRALAGVLARDEEIARYSPTSLVAEFDTMMRSAMDLRQELVNLQQVTVNFSGEPDVVVPAPFPELSGRDFLTMSLLSGQQMSGRDSVIASGWEVDALVRRASDVYLEMVFRDGLYHADPHPGNFLLPDGGHLAILDFGDVGHLTGPRRDQLEALLVAVAARDVEELVDVVVELTHPPRDFDRDRLAGQIETWLNRYLSGGVGDLDMTAMVAAGMQIMHDNTLTFPADLALLFRVLLRLQGLGSAIGANVSLTELLRPYLNQMVADRLDPAKVLRQVRRTVRGWERLVASAPADLRSIMDQLTSGQVGVDFRIHDPDGVTDRLVDGLLGAASLLAAAQLVGRRSGPTIAGVSVPGLAALAVGVGTWQRLAWRRNPHASGLSRVRELVVSRRR